MLSKILTPISEQVQRRTVSQNENAAAPRFFEIVSCRNPSANPSRNPSANPSAISDSRDRVSSSVSQILESRRR